MEHRNSQTQYQSDGNRLWGYAAIWDSPTTVQEHKKTYTEIVKRGAFTRSLSSSDILCCFNHDPNKLLGRTQSGSLQLIEDDKGLRFEVQLPETELGREIRALAARGDLTGASFAFTSNKEQWQGNTRQLLDVNLFECGPVVVPAYKDTEVGLRSNNKFYKAKLNLYLRS